VWPDPIPAPPPRAGLWDVPPDQRGQPRTVHVDTSAFTRTELPVAGPPQKRAKKPSPLASRRRPAPSPSLMAGSRPTLTAIPPLEKRRPRQPEAVAAAEPVPDVPALPPVPALPNTAMDLETRLSELACTLEITTEGRALVKFRGWPLVQVHTSRSTDRSVILFDYQVILEAIADMFAGSQRAISARDEARRRLAAMNAH
jgi:hypothetical protein